MIDSRSIEADQAECSAAPALHAAPPASPRAARRRSKTFEALGVLFVCTANLIIMLRTPKAGTPDAAYQAAAAAAAALLMLLAVLCLPGRVYWRLRQVAIPAMRIAYHLQAGERSATVGAKATVAGLMLSGAPRPGPLWAAADVMRALTGLRLLSNALVTLIFELPLPLAAAVHVAVVALTAGDNEAYCATPLLAHPLMQSRLRRFASAMHVSTAFATPLGTAIARKPAEHACLDVVRFCQVAFAVVPLVLLAWWEQQDAMPPHAAGRPAARPPAAAQRGPGRAWHALSRCVHLACGGAFSWPQRVAMLAWLFSMLWLVTTF